VAEASSLSALCEMACARYARSFVPSSQPLAKVCASDTALQSGPKATSAPKAKALGAIGPSTYSPMYEMRRSMPPGAAYCEQRQKALGVGVGLGSGSGSGVSVSLAVPASRGRRRPSSLAP
jgi:hypothetical protein